MGNRAVSRLIRSGGLQAKLRIGQPGDKYEQEADRVAEQVMRMPEPGVQRQVEPEEEEEETLQSKPLANQITPLVQVQRQEELEEEEEMLQAKPLAEEITPLVQRQVEPEEEEEEETLQAKPLAEEITPFVQRQVEPEEEEEEEVQAKATSGHLSEVTPNLESRIQSLKGGGQPLPKSDRAYFEPRFGRDFSRVRVHTDAQAVESARAVNARAFTMGQDVVFGAGQYAPGASTGQRLMAHELTHVVQQGAAVQRSPAIMTTVSGKTPVWIQRGVLSWIKEKAGRVWGGIRGIGRSTWNAVKRVGPFAVSVARRLGKSAAILIKRYGDRVVGFLSRWGSRAIGWIKHFGIRVVGWIERWSSRAIVDIRVVGVPEALQIMWKFFNKTRPLNSAEIAASQQVHAPGLIPYHNVRVDENSILTRINKMRAFVSFHIIHYPRTSLLPHIVVHELTHVAQYEKAGSIYMFEALHAQFIGKGYPYGDLVAARRKGKRFSKFNREQQATICEDYYKAKNNKPIGNGGSKKDLKHYVDQMNSGDF